MSIIRIEPATRSGMRLVILMYGLSQSGKTLSALRVAAGIEPNPAKRGLLDTEGGQRGRAYVDQIEGGYLYGALTAPYTPERYIEAVSDFERSGTSVLVIDSISHVWEGEGGVLDMVEGATERNEMAKWRKPKGRFAKLKRRLLHRDMHIILCSRAKQPLIETSLEGRKQLAPGPITPIIERSLRYDMTIVAQMLGDGQFTVDPPAGKCPGDLRAAFASQLLDESVGRRLSAWADSPKMKTQDQRALEDEAERIAEQGTDALREWWKELDAEKRASLSDAIENLRSIALSSEGEREENVDGQ